MPFGYGALLFLEIDVQSAVWLYGDAHRLIGLTIAEFGETVERIAFLRHRRRRNPIHAAHLARNGIEGRFVAVGNVQYVVCEIFFHHKPPAFFLFAFQTAEIQAFALTECVVHQPFVAAHFFPGKIENFTRFRGQIAA